MKIYVSNVTCIWAISVLSVGVAVFLITDSYATYKEREFYNQCRIKNEVVLNRLVNKPHVSCWIGSQNEARR